MEQSLMTQGVIPESAAESPSRAFVCAVARLLETDATDILLELGYDYPEGAFRGEDTQPAQRSAREKSGREIRC